MTLSEIFRERKDKIEMQRSEAKAEVLRLEALLRKGFEFESLFIVGSLVSGRFGRRSDIDLIIKGLKPEDFFKAHALLLRESSFDIDLKPYEDLSEAFQSDVRKKGVKVG